MLDWLTKQTDRLADKFQEHKFHVESSPPDNLDTSSTISITTYTSRQKQAVVPCSFQWSRLKNGLMSEATDFKGNCFICQPSDVGCTVLAEITSTEASYPGTVTVKFGPIRLEVNLKQSIENALSFGEYTARIDLLGGKFSKECQIRVRDDLIKISHLNSISSFKFTYDLTEPIIDVRVREPTLMSIIFNERYAVETTRFLTELFGTDAPQHTCLDFNFPSRRMKDQCLFVIKAFNAKKEMRGSAVIKKIEKMEFAGDSLEELLEMQSIKSDMRKICAALEKDKQVKTQLEAENKRLELKTLEIISSYTAIIETKFRRQEEIDLYQASLLDKIRHLEARQQRPAESTPQSPKGSPFAKKQEQSQNYERILSQLEASPESQSALRMSKSLHYKSIPKDDIPEMNESAVSVSNRSAMQISLKKVIEEKIKVEGKYEQLKEEYSRVKEERRAGSPTSSVACNPENGSNECSHKKIRATLEERMAELAKEKQFYHQKASFLEEELRKEREEHGAQLKRRDKQIKQLRDQIRTIQKGQDALNRSQHLSMEMESYNEEQNSALKSQNSFLLAENERLTTLCGKYREGSKSSSQQLPEQPSRLN